MNKSLDAFTLQYSLSKTLRFELKPVGKTAEWIQERDIIGTKKQENGEALLTGKDAERAENYKYAKKLLDSMHRLFIEDALASINEEQKIELNQLFVEIAKSGSLDEFRKPLSKLCKELFDSATQDWLLAYSEEMPCLWDEDIAEFTSKAEATENKKDKKFFIKKTEDIRKLKADPLKAFKKKKHEALTSNTEALKLLEWKIRKGEVRASGKELGRDKSEEILSKGELILILRSFYSFVTYFSGFNENRTNIYNLDDKKYISTSIAFRSFEQNLFFHIENIKKWRTVTKSIEDYSDKLNASDYSIQEKLRELEVAFNCKLEDFLAVDSFSQFLSQSGIDHYNSIMGGFAQKTGKTKVQGLNEIINQIRQQTGAKRYKFPPMKLLYKQILSKGESVFFESYVDDAEMLNSIAGFHENHLNESVCSNWLNELDELIHSVQENKDSIFIARNKLNRISQVMTGSWSTIQDWIVAHQKDQKAVDALTKKKVFSIKELENYFSKSLDDELFTAKIPKDRSVYLPDEGEGILFHFFKVRVKEILAEVQTGWYALDEAQLLQEKQLDKNRENEGSKGFEQVGLLKGYLDACNSLSRFIADWNIQKDIKQEKCTLWYEFLQKHLDTVPISDLYNQVHNHVSKKAYSTDKVKLNFDHSKLLGGFVESRTEKSDNGTQYGAYLFRKKDSSSFLRYYLGISKDFKLFRFHEADKILKEDKSSFERFYYYQMKETSFYGSSYAGNYTKDKELLIDSIRNFITGKNLHLEIEGDQTPTSILTNIEKEYGSEIYEELFANPEFQQIQEQVIENIRNTLKGYQGKINEFDNVISNLPKRIGDVLQYISCLAKEKMMIFLPVSETEWNSQFTKRKDDENQFYLFEITNKDLNPDVKTTGRDNLHTYYFKNLFMSGQNTIDLGKGEIFFRQSSLKKHETYRHKIGEVLKHKRYSKEWNLINLPVPQITKWEEIQRHPKLEIINDKVLYQGKVIGKKCKHKIIKDRRFTVDKYLLHLSIILNYKEGKPVKNVISNKVHDFLRKNEEVNVIGIDRGEKHLLYYSVTNQQGDIIEQGSLNSIVSSYQKGATSVPHSTNYLEKLQEKEKNRDVARKSWSRIENIKELKAGYLSHVVHKLAQLIIKHNAIVVLEDLNAGFKRGRFKVERQVYQKFEKALIDKLNYLVFKDQEKPSATGHPLRAYQLTDPFMSFKDIEKRKQSGILFYTTAAYTSTTDPVTGFLKNVYKPYANVVDSTDFWKSFDEIHYDVKKERFEFTYDLRKIKNKQVDRDKDEAKVSRSVWTVCSCVERSRYVKHNANEEQKQGTASESLGKMGEYEVFVVTDKLKALFEKESISYKSGEDIRDQLSNRIDKKDAKLHRELIYYFGTLLNMRVTDKQSESGTDENDYILSPVEPFFDSRKGYEKLPVNGDANGAYNIARKGIAILNRIHVSESGDKIDLTIRKKDWQDYVQDEAVVQKQVEKLIV